MYSETPIESQPSSSQEQLQLDQSTDHIAPVISNCIDNRSMALRNFVTDLFPSATLEESFADRLVYSVPQQAVSSLAECFSRLEKGKGVLFCKRELLYLHNVPIVIVSICSQDRARHRGILIQPNNTRASVLKVCPLRRGNVQCAVRSCRSRS